MEGKEQKVEIALMLGCDRYSLDLWTKEVIKAFEGGINAIALFPAILKKKKNGTGTESYNLEGLLQQY